jgi:hypothetical protein
MGKSLVDRLRNEYDERIEGSAASALAEVLSGKISTRPAVIVLSGGNIQSEAHNEIPSTGGQ